MNKTAQYLKQRQNILSIYFTVDYPKRGNAKETILALQNSGVDIIEVGIPFSDPLADGPVIQNSSKIALENGFALDRLFDDLVALRSQIQIPLVLMGYFNTALVYGIEQFLSRSRDCGIDTVILPDLPPEIYQKTYAELFRRYDVSPVFLITPQTSGERVDFIINMSDSFLYAVADNSITGGVNGLLDRKTDYFREIKKRDQRIPVLVGFGVSTHRDYSLVCEYAHGAIIGSAFIRALESADNPLQTIHEFVKTIRG